MTRTLWDVLSAIADRRGRKGRQLPLPGILAIAIAAMLGPTICARFSAGAGA